MLATQERVRSDLLPQYHHLFTMIARLNDGVKFITDVRKDCFSSVKYVKDQQHVQHIRYVGFNSLDLWLWFIWSFTYRHFVLFIRFSDYVEKKDQKTSTTVLTCLFSLLTYYNKKSQKKWTPCPSSFGTELIINSLNQCLAGLLEDDIANLSHIICFFRGLSDYLKDTLSLWFSVGLLQLQRISWEHTSANIIEKVRQTCVCNIMCLEIDSD